MPPAIAKKEVAKKLAGNMKTSKTSLKTNELKPNVVTNLSTEGAGENPVKKPPKKKKKFEDEKASVKRLNVAGADRVPKKHAHRAKGSISLNTTAEEKAQEEAVAEAAVTAAEKKKLPAVPKAKEESKTEGRKVPTSVRSKTSKASGKKESSGPATDGRKGGDLEKASRHILEEASCEALEKTVEAVNGESREVSSSEIRSMVNLPFGSCSFFEKLQQGVKAYFSSKNTLAPSEHPKKEGGIRTRARVAKGVKEDAKKRNPGLLKNEIYNSESDLFHDQLRLNLSLGGKSSNFSTTKPKIFQKFKRKKLYRPKKHYVRIQIPRKGYFYRSTVQFKAPGSQGPVHPLEPRDMPKNEPKTQVSGMASTGPKSSNLPNKKTVTDFEEKAIEYLAFDWPDQKVSCRSFEQVYFVNDFLSEFISLGLEREKQMGEVSQTARSSEDQKTRNDDYSDVLESSNSTYNTLVNQLNSALEREDLLYDLEITPVNGVEGYTEFNATLKDHEDFDYDSDALYISPVPSSIACELNARPNADNFTASLMDGIDLHLELQNYIKAFDEFQAKSDLYEFQSVSSFESAKSSSTQTRYLERKPELSSMAEEHLDVSTVHVNQIRKTKSETDPRKLLNSPRPFTLNKKLPAAGLTDSYEKIQPFCKLPKFRLKPKPLLQDLEAEEPISSTPKPQASQIWSPTLQDLVEIYNSVLKQNKKIKRNTNNSVNNCFSSHLFSFLNNKLKEKKFKTNLIKLSKDFSSNYVTPKGWKTVKTKDDSVKEYVSMFQELLQSSLSINQIARLNNTISGLQNYSEKNYNIYKRVKDTNKSQPKPKSKTKPKSKPRKPENIQEQPLLEKIEQIKLNTPTELVQMLKSAFNYKEIVCTDPDPSDTKTKILVTVKLSGDRVLVSGLSYFNNEKALSQQRPRQKGTSELIIESVSKDQVKNVWYRKTKSSILRELTHARSNDIPKTFSKKPKKTPTQTRPSKPTKKTTQGQGTFEYDQSRLRAQHPIDAIIESSESKTSDISEEVTKSKPLSKVLEPCTNPTALKEALKTALEKNDLFKELIAFKKNDILDRAKSNVNVPQTGKQRLRKKSKTEKVKSMVDLRSRPNSWKKSRKTSPSPPLTYLCYSFVQGKTKRSAGRLKEKKPVSQKPQTEPSLSKAPPAKEDKAVEVIPETEAVEPTKSLSNTVLYLNSEVVTDCCSIELLLADNNKNPPTTATSNASFSKSIEKQTTSNHISADPLPPTVLYPVNSAIYNNSFPSSVIHSDSFLKCFSRLAVTKSKLNTLFRSNSDMKFYPGKVKEKEEEEVKPLVTFLLTPTQNEKMKFSNSKVEIIEKTRAPVPDVPHVPDVDERDRAQEKFSQEINEQISLELIEEFIRQLSESRKKKQEKRKPEQSNQKLELGSKKKNKSLIEAKKIEKRKTEKILSKQTKTSSNLKKRKKPRTSPFFHGNIDNNLSRVLDNLKKYKVEKTKQSEPKPEESVGKQSAKQDVQVELLEALKTAISGAENLTNKEEIITLIEKEFEHQQRKLPEGREDGHKEKRVKTLKIKIHCNEHKCLREEEKKVAEEKRVMEGKGELELLDSLLLEEPEGGDLERKQSTYFDAVDKSLRDNIWRGGGGGGGGVEEEEGEETGYSGNKEQTFEAVFSRKTGTEVKEVKSKEIQSTVTVSDEPKSALQASDETILEEINKSLDSGKIPYSKSLVEEFLKKTVNYSDDPQTCLKIKRLLLMVEDKSRKLMMSMERNAWLKVLSLLDEVSEVFENQNIREFTKKTYLQTTKVAFDKIQSLNVSRSIDLQNFCSSLSPPQVPKGEVPSLLGKITESFRQFRRKFTLQRNCPFRDKGLESGEFGIKLHPSPSLPQMKEAHLIHPEERGDLKKKILQQMSCIELLIQTDSDSTPTDIQDLKDKVAEKMKYLEKKFLEYNLEVEKTATTSSSWGKATSLLNMAKNCKETGAEKKEGRRDKEVKPKPGYLDLVQSFIKVWDTRMSLHSFCSEI